MTLDSMVELKEALSLIMSEDANADDFAADEEVMAFAFAVSASVPAGTMVLGENSPDVTPTDWCWSVTTLSTMFGPSTQSQASAVASIKVYGFLDLRRLPLLPSNRVNKSRDPGRIKAKTRTEAF